MVTGDSNQVIRGWSFKARPACCVDDLGPSPKTITVSEVAAD